MSCSDCRKRTWEMVNIFRRNGLGSDESLGYFRCLLCGQMWLIRHKFHLMKHDDIWLLPGETQGEYTFERAAARSMERILDSDGVDFLPEGLASDNPHVCLLAQKVFSCVIRSGKRLFPMVNLSRRKFSDHVCT